MERFANFALASLCVMIAGAANATNNLAKDVTGVYKHTHDNGFFNPQAKDGVDHFKTEDVLEILPYGDENIYFRKRTHFFNGHTCDVYGIAEQVDDEKFIFKDQNSAGLCTLEMSISGKKIIFKDVSESTETHFKACKIFCGARGNINDEWERSRKRKIRYTKRILDSREYENAIKAYNGKE